MASDPANQHNAALDSNDHPSLIGVSGTLGTSDTGGTAKIVRVSVNGSTGALFVQDLSGVSGTTNTLVVGGTLNAGTFTSTGTNVNIVTGTQQTLGTVGVLNNGTLAQVTTVNTVTDLTSGSVRMTVGTVTTGSLTNVANLLNGTVGVVNNLVTGTLAALATGTITVGTFREDTRPVGSVVQSTHTLGTGGGTFVGTLVAPTGAGTSLYLAGLSIVGQSGTTDCGIANNVAGTTGAGVYARGFFPPSGGIARDFNPPINLGTNGTLAYFLITAGTASFTVNYIVST